MGYVSENLNKFNTTSEKRGRDYFYQGAVKSLSFDGTNASAIVSGTSEYSVSANFDGHKLKSWSCSCPYSFGGACKHVVALLCALDDRESSLGRQKGASGDKARENRDYVEASNLVQDAFAKLMEGRTCFIVAHRLSTIQNADLILVMKAGRVVEQGTHAQLLARGGFYSELYNAQFAQ